MRLASAKEDPPNLKTQSIFFCRRVDFHHVRLVHQGTNTAPYALLEIRTLPLFCLSSILLRPLLYSLISSAKKRVVTVGAEVDFAFIRLEAWKLHEAAGIKTQRKVAESLILLVTNSPPKNKGQKKQRDSGLQKYFIDRCNSVVIGWRFWIWKWVEKISSIRIGGWTAKCSTSVRPFARCPAGSLVGSFPFPVRPSVVLHTTWGWHGYEYIPKSIHRNHKEYKKLQTWTVFITNMWGSLWHMCFAICV